MNKQQKMSEKQSYKDRVADWEKARFAPPPAPDLNPIKPSLTKMVPMRDGVRLYTEVFFPIGNKGQTEGFPVILIRSPYPYSCPSLNGKVGVGRYLDEDFAVVFQLTRGQGMSEGIFRQHSDDIHDGYDCIDWVTKQLWCDGNIGMQGPSYLGSTQLQAARAKHPALKCIMPTAFVGDFTRIFPYLNGIPMRSVFMQWYKVADLDRMDDLDATYGDTALLKHPVWGKAFRHRPLIEAADKILKGDKLASWKDCIRHPLDDDFWQGIHFTDQELLDLDLPIFFTDGWYDSTIGPIDFFSRLEALQPNRSDRYLLVGPWNHYQTANNSVDDPATGDRSMPENAAQDLWSLRLAFFERYLKGNQDVEVQKGRVRVYITGAKGSDANRWINTSTFPVPGTEALKFYLHSEGDARSFPSDGSLTLVVPGNEPKDHYVYDPSLPTPTETEELTDRREIEIRSDVLTYTTAPLKKPITILGELELALYAATDCKDTDWFAQLTEVFPGGRYVAFHYGHGGVRARYREGLTEEKLIPENTVKLFTISLGLAGHQIAAGNQLRLSIFSSNFPLFDPNTNTGNEVISDVESRVARQTIFHDVDHPSHIILPAISME